MHDNIIITLEDILKILEDEEERFALSYIINLYYNYNYTTSTHITQYPKLINKYNEIKKIIEESSLLDNNTTIINENAYSVIENFINEKINTKVLKKYANQITQVFNNLDVNVAITKLESILQEIKTLNIKKTERFYDFGLSASSVYKSLAFIEELETVKYSNSFITSLPFNNNKLYSKLWAFLNEPEYKQLLGIDDISGVSQEKIREIRNYFALEHINKENYKIMEDVSLVLPLERKTTFIVSAVTGGGKSLFLLNLAYNLIYHNNCNVLYVSNELTYKQILERLIKIIFTYYFAEHNKISTPHLDNYLIYVAKEYENFLKDINYKPTQNITSTIINEDKKFLKYTSILKGRLFIKTLKYASNKLSMVLKEIEDAMIHNQETYDVVIFDYIEPFALENSNNSGSGFGQYIELGIRVGLMRQFAFDTNALVITATQEKIDIGDKKKNKDNNKTNDNSHLSTLSSIAESKKMLHLADYVLSVKLDKKSDIIEPDNEQDYETITNSNIISQSLLKIQKLNVKTLKNRQGINDYFEKFHVFSGFNTIVPISFYSPIIVDYISKSNQKPTDY